MASSLIAFIFPGQGSQRIGMLAGAYGEFAEVRKTFTEASETLGYDLWKLAQEGPVNEQNLTEKTQPLLLTASVALWRAWCRANGRAPDYMTGHSLGEFSALVCAGALDFHEALHLVRARGQFMQSAVPVGVGAMAAIIGLPEDEILAICQQCSVDRGEVKLVVEAVNFNSPEQIVIAGHVANVEMAMAECKLKGAKRALLLPVSAPFHTSLMKIAGVQLGRKLELVSMHPPRIPVIHNVHAKPEKSVERIKQLLVDQISSPVRWVACIQTLAHLGVSRVVECGAGQVLCGLNKRINKEMECFSIEEVATFHAANAALSAVKD